jgi:hypothetical protein
MSEKGCEIVSPYGSSDDWHFQYLSLLPSKVAIQTFRTVNLLEVRCRCRTSLLAILLYGFLDVADAARTADYVAI